jgi:hypothetical protein
MMTKRVQPELPAEWCFPKPLFRIDRSLEESPPPDDLISVYLGQVRLWHSTVQSSINRADEAPGLEIGGLSDRARRTLAVFLASDWSHQMTERASRSPYSIDAFPAGALSSGRKPVLAAVLEILRWRAGFNDYLADVWDLLGEPELDLYECMAIGTFLHPANQAGLCGNCLTEFEPDQRHPDQHGCLLLAHVRAKWPASPFARLRSEAPKPRAWWHFWK